MTTQTIADGDMPVSINTSTSSMIYNAMTIIKGMTVIPNAMNTMVMTIFLRCGFCLKICTMLAKLSQGDQLLSENIAIFV